ncbi:AMP-dependent synthetase/ligase [Sphingobacterium bovistauri]|uniref:Long-chain fatty acid--CoA ligase n=1 Tax=Sphingobacterium bovistauri TaxID=2781959 RepID=A0ABS7ZAT8_9SPHI|nr:long-chain fatty acid--CoA ligase [Sphingobacterium bovistauri]MCA5005980.1 long-chain fatty acid--CoA ligase [Sphingobacterium bovistauri]
MKNEPTRIFDLVKYRTHTYATSPIFSHKENNDWKKISNESFQEQIDEISKGLIALGVKPHDKVGIISENRLEWSLLDFAIQQIGAIVVALYPNISDNDYKYIINHAEIKIAVISSKDLYERINILKSEFTQLENLFILQNETVYPHWTIIHQSGKVISDQQLSDRKKAVQHEDIATIIYTSGTTGNPKGVMLTHKNLLADMMSSEYSFPVTSYMRALSFLPVCHAYERLFHYVYMYKGLTIFYANSMETIGADMKEVKPHIFSAVPRVLEKVYEKIMTTGNSLTGIKRKLFFWAIELGEKYDLEPNNRSTMYDIKLAIARKLIFSKWKEALGGEILGVATGSAALQERLIRLYMAAGINIYEGYGLTEAGPCLSVNDYRRGMKIGTVGLPLINIDIKLAADGEILAKGDNIMLGYYKDEQVTQEVIKDGWLYTGDIGQWEDERFLKIVDRKKEMFKTSGGKYIVPQAIESKMVESPFIEQFMVIGDGEKFPAAFIVPSYSNLLAWSKDSAQGNVSLSKDQFLSSDAIKSKITEEINLVNKSFGQWEQIKKFSIIPDEFTIEGGELTPTLKMKRKKIIEKHINNYREIYAV